MLAVVATDLDGRVRDLLNDFDELRITPQLNGYTQVDVKGVDPLSSVARDLLVAERALKVYDLDAAALRFFGQIWEPLDRSPAGIDVSARDPFATFAWRRVRDPATATYTATDFGSMLVDRVARQNAIRNTYLRSTAGNRQLSTNATRAWPAGKREDEIFGEVVDANGSPFFRVDPVDNVAGVMGDLIILYPNAGATRENVRFGYGDGTIDNCTDYKITYGLPLNRFTTSSSDSDGGRLAQPFEDTPSIARYGLFEDETTYSEATDTTTLAQQAQGSVRSDPAYTITIAPGLDAPLLYRDFNVGDFVRVRIRFGTDDLFTWARVLTATLAVDRDGTQRLDSLTVDVLSGAANATTAPEDWYRARLDEERRRLESLERRLQLLSVTNTQSSTAPPAAGGSSTDPSTDPPTDPSAPPSPPPTPDDPPTVYNLAAAGASTTQIQVDFDYTTSGIDTTATIWAEQGGTIRQIATVGLGTGASHSTVTLGGLVRNSAYGIHVRVASAGGANQADGAATTPHDDF